MSRLSNLARSCTGSHRDVSSLSLLLIVVFVVMWSMTSHRFIAPANLQGMGMQMAELGLLSLAMMLSMLSGGINLAVVATANCAGIVTALALTSFLGGADSQETGTLAVLALTGLALLAGLLTAAVTGSLIGALIAYAKVSPVLASLGMMTLLQGISHVLTDGRAISGLPSSIHALGNGMFLGIPIAFLIFIGSALAVGLLLQRTRYGFFMYRLGANPVATHYAGVDNRRILLLTYILSGLLSGMASLIMISRFNSAKADFGESYLLVTILAVVLGGTNPNGGSGKVTGLVLALAIYQVLSSGLNFLRVSPFLGLVLWGATMLVVMGLQHGLRGRFNWRGRFGIPIGGRGGGN